MECAVCGRDFAGNMLLDVISMKEVIKVCEACATKEQLPVLRRPNLNQLKEAEKIIPYYKKVGDFRGKNTGTSIPQRADTSLKQIVDRNYEKRIQSEKKPRPDLVDNFHWVIMRARRAKKITQEQLAQTIGEAEAAVKMAEDGVMPDDGYRLVKKLESFLGITLVKGESAKAIVSSLEPPKAPARILKFDPSIVHDFTISDLKRMREEREEAGKEGDIEFDDADLEEFHYEEGEEYQSEKDRD